ncbi:MAG: hypothetical protein ACFE9D_07930 [Promethearchaeota archaeon]
MEKRILVIGLSLTLSLAFSFSPSDFQSIQPTNIQSSLVTTIRVNKSVYFIAEPIFIQLSFFNPTSSPISITGLDNFPFCIEIRRGDEIFVQAGHGVHPALTTFTIESQETFTFEYVYDASELGPEYTLPPGYYQVHGYFYGNGGHLDASVFIMIIPVTAFHALIILVILMILVIFIWSFTLLVLIIWQLWYRRKKGSRADSW